MSVRNGLVLVVALCAVMFLAGCGGSGSGAANPVAPPSSSFGSGTLNGSYVFTASGFDNTGSPYSMAGTLAANGNGGITGGTIDLNDASTGFVADATINNNSSYTVTVDGRGELKIGTNITGLSVLNLYFALSSTSGGLITESDNFGEGTGTLDVQTANVTPSGAYAFSFSGAPDASPSTTLAAVGNFTVAAGGAISPSGLADFNDNGAAAYTAQTLTGSVVVSSSAPSTTLSTPQYPGLTFDVFPIDSSHLKFIEMDANGTLLGDAYSQSTATLPTGTLPFTLLGTTSAGAPFAAGGFFVTDGNGNITDSSSEDFNSGGTLSPTTPVSFSGSYTADGTGRYTLGSFASFTGGSTYAAYPSSGGVLLLEIDAPGGLTTGAAYGPQSASATFTAGQGYALGFAGSFLGTAELPFADVFDSGEFVAASSGNTISSGAIDEASISSAGFGIAYGVPLTAATFTSPSGGRGNVTATAQNGSNSTQNGGFSLTYYVLDGTTFPFIETDSSQVSAGIFVQQNAGSSTGAIAKTQSMFVPRSPFHTNVKPRER